MYCALLSRFRQPPPSPEQHEAEEPVDGIDQEIESVAYVLASLDQKAHAEAQVMDANRICAQLLLPLSLPWTYPEQGLDATSPLDLDDLPMLIRGDLGDHELSRTTVEPTDDPGVLRLTCYDIDESHFQDLNVVSQPGHLSDNGSNVSQELSLLYYEAVVARKRKMDELVSSGKVKTLVSIRFDQTSSRSSLHPYLRNSGDAIPLYLAALFPRSLQVGHRLRGPEAVALAKAYGTYNCRGLPPIVTNANGIFEQRIWVGRNRLAWSEKEMNHKKNRGVYRSMLTKKRSDVAGLKRPLAVKVSVRLNGRLVTTTNADVKESIDKVLLNVADPNVEHQASMYSEATLDECLQSVEGAALVEVRPAVVPNFMQCNINPDALFQNTARDLEEARRGGGWNAVRRLRQPIRFSIQSDSQFVDEKVTDADHTVGFRPPHLDCFGTVDGLVHVGCTRTGSFSSSSVEDGDEVSLALLQEFAIKYGRCFVCWGRCSESSLSRSIVRCSVCAIVLHCECANVSEHDRSEWVCWGCDDNDDDSATHQIRGSRGKCCQCPLPLGLLKRVGSDVMHQVCATWKDAAATSTNIINNNIIINNIIINNKDQAVCCLCSAGSGAVVECAAEGCRVKFHPSCAVLASAFGDLDNTSGSPDDDIYLCTQYTLSMVDVTISSPRGSGSDDVESMKLPVAFCGYHNPRRIDMLHGLYPEGCYLDPDSESTLALRIPPKRSTHVAVVSNDDDDVDDDATESDNTEVPGGD
jgi:PHD-zinc-finger like domain